MNCALPWRRKSCAGSLNIVRFNGAHFFFPVEAFGEEISVVSDEEKSGKGIECRVDGYGNGHVLGEANVDVEHWKNEEDHEGEVHHDKGDEGLVDEGTEQLGLEEFVG